MDNQIPNIVYYDFGKNNCNLKIIGRLTRVTIKLDLIRFVLAY